MACIEARGLKKAYGNSIALDGVDLTVEEGRILVVDYKTGRAPERAEDIPASHRLQMEAYAEALAVIFPKRDIEAALLYTSNGRFFTVGS